MKNAGKACNNRLYRHIRTFEKIVKNYFVISVKNHTKTLIVQEGITSLDWILFYRFTKLSEVRFPSSLSNIIIESVGEYIDFGVMPLKTLTISEKLSENFLKIATAENIQLIK